MDFQKLDALKKEIAELSKYHASSLRIYFGAPAPEDLVRDRNLLGFRHTLEPRGDKRSFSRASTSTCILSLSDSGLWSDNDPTLPWAQYTQELLHNLLFLTWESSHLPPDNPFTTAFQIEAVGNLLNSAQVKPTPDQRKQIERGCSVLHTALMDGLIGFPGFPPSTYLTHLGYSAYTAGLKLLYPQTEPPKKLHPQLVQAKIEWACWHELNKHLALIRCGSRTADCYQMAYAALVVGGIDRVTDLTPEQSSLLNLAIDVLFEAMGEDGTWPRSQPLFHYPDFGSAYCFEYELLSRLLRTPRLQEHWLRHLESLVRAFKGLRVTAMPKQEDGSIVAYLWSSGAKTWEPEAESWSTASAYQFLFHLDRVIAEAIRRSIFHYLGAPYTAPTTPRHDRALFAQGFLDCPIQSTEVEEDGVIGALFNHFVEPIARGARRIELGRPLERLVPMSAILFGPPGTSKTELSKLIADYLNWPRIAIDPSHFMRRGLDQLQAEADQVFAMLASAERVVVLLDEIDELVRAREDSPEPLNRFLTTAMLPKLIAINRSRRIVFLVATNHLESFDVAIKRPGRFDLVLQVLPPKLQEKVGRPHWKALIEKAEKGWEPLESNVELEHLTFDEFDVLLRRLASANGTKRKKEILKSAIEHCTLNQRISERDGETKKWMDLVREQSSRVSFPHVEAPEQGRLFGSQAVASVKKDRSTKTLPRRA